MSFPSSSQHYQTAGKHKAMTPTSGLASMQQIFGVQVATDSLQHEAYNKIYGTRMWANAQRDGRPAEHRWRPLFNAAKFG